jgi:hypothetical protein
MEDQALKYVGVLMRQVFFSIHRGYEAMIKRFGVTQETLNGWNELIDTGMPISHRSLNCPTHLYCRAKRNADPYVVPNSILLG